MLITEHPAIEQIKADLAEIEETVVMGYTLADAMREGSQHTEQARTWLGESGSVCALSAAFLSAKARGRV